MMVASRKFLLQDLGENEEELFFKKKHLKRKGIDFKPQKTKNILKQAKGEKKRKLSRLIDLKKRIDRAIHRTKKGRPTRIKGRPLKRQRKKGGVRKRGFSKGLKIADRVFIGKPPKMLRF